APTDSDVQVVVPQGAHSGAVSVSDGTTTTPAPSAFTVLPTASLKTSSGSVVYPATAVLTAKVASGSAGIPGQPGRLQSQPLGSSTWTNGAQASTDSSGTIRFTVKPRAS